MNDCRVGEGMEGMRREPLDVCGWKSEGREEEVLARVIYSRNVVFPLGSI